MKETTTLLGILGVVGVFFACSADTVSSPYNEQTPGNQSSSKPVTGGNNSNNDPYVKDSVIHESVYLDSTTGYIAPYSSNSPTFCWSAKCEAAAASSSSQATIDINMSVEAQDPPTINGNKMIDNRDGKQYTIETINGKLWMAQNLNYETKNGYFCKTSSSEDMCGTYGGFYSFSAAQRACPTTWRLPTQDEIEALDAAVKHEWWQVGGRFKLSGGEPTDYGDADKQGYFWLSSGQAWKIKNFDGDQAHGLQDEVSDRAYNVRCVADQ